MPKRSKPREGSMQFYPRVRAKKLLPKVSWRALKNDEVGLLGFIGYKVGMKSAYVKDNTSNSLTKGKRIIVPVTIIECPSIKILSVRFYKNNKVMGEVLNNNINSEMKKKIKLPKKQLKKIDDYKDFDEVRVIIYTDVKKTGIKKKPDISEIGLSGTNEEKLKFIKENLSKEIRINEVFNIEKNKIVDIRGVTTGKGFQGPTKRFGLALKTHKEEKGKRGPGSGGPWHPARVEFTQPMAGQMGYSTRTVINNNIVDINSIKEKDINPENGFKKYGKIRTDYLILQGSIQGPVKRQLIISMCLRPTKSQLKKNYELMEVR
jgi:large subunit ribosomal protein L3